MAGRKRNKSLNLRMTCQEFQKFEDKYLKVKNKFSNQTDFFLNVLSEKNIIIIDDYKPLLKELKIQGNNLNQLLKNLYLYGYCIESQVLDVLNNCNEVYEKLITLEVD